MTLNFWTFLKRIFVNRNFKTEFLCWPCYSVEDPVDPCCTIYVISAFKSINLAVFDNVYYDKHIDDETSIDLKSTKYFPNAKPRIESVYVYLYNGDAF